MTKAKESIFCLTMEGCSSLFYSTNLKNRYFFSRITAGFPGLARPKFKFDKDKYQVRFKVERCFAWLENFWRIKIRREYRLAMFKAFVYLAAIIILIRN